MSISEIKKYIGEGNRKMVKQTLEKLSKPNNKNPNLSDTWGYYKVMSEVVEYMEDVALEFLPVKNKKVDKLLFSYAVSKKKKNTTIKLIDSVKQGDIESGINYTIDDEEIDLDYLDILVGKMTPKHYVGLYDSCCDRDSAGLLSYIIENKKFTDWMREAIITDNENGRYLFAQLTPISGQGKNEDALRVLLEFFDETTKDMNLEIQEEYQKQIERSLGSSATNTKLGCFDFLCSRLKNNNKAKEWALIDLIVWGDERNERALYKLLDEMESDGIKKVYLSLNDKEDKKIKTSYGVVEKQTVMNVKDLYPLFKIEHDKRILKESVGVARVGGKKKEYKI